MIYRTQRILLSPTVAQSKLFAGSAGLSRFAWNWALGICKRHYEIFGRGPDGKTRKGYSPVGKYRLNRHWNKTKHNKRPWVKSYSKLIPEASFAKLESAFKQAFRRARKTGRFTPPVFKRKYQVTSFEVVPNTHRQLKRVGKRLLVPRIGMVRCESIMRWPDAVQANGRIKLIAGRWWLVMSFELPDPAKLPEGRPTCGIDLGCTTFVTIASGGEVVEEVKPPKPYAKAKRRLRRMKRKLDRRKSGSRRRHKLRIRLARIHARIADVRDNFLHQLTTMLVRSYGAIVIEDLNVKGMAMGGLSDLIRDMGFGYFRKFIAYKAATTGTNVVLANRFYPSSKTCYKCGVVKDVLSLKEREYRCECGWVIGRDANAALNLEKLPQSMGKVTPVESGGSGKRKQPGAARRNGNTAATGQR